MRSTKLTPLLAIIALIAVSGPATAAPLPPQAAQFMSGGDAGILRLSFEEAGGDGWDATDVVLLFVRRPDLVDGLPPEGSVVRVGVFPDRGTPAFETMSLDPDGITIDAFGDWRLRVPVGSLGALTILVRPGIPSLLPISGARGSRGGGRWSMAPAGAASSTGLRYEAIFSGRSQIISGPVYGAAVEVTGTALELASFGGIVGEYGALRSGPSGVCVSTLCAYVPVT